MSDAKLVWMDGDEWNAVEAVCQDDPYYEPYLTRLGERWHEARYPRRINICVTHGRGKFGDATGWTCPRGEASNEDEPCVFETLYAVPADSQPQPPSETT